MTLEQFLAKLEQTPREWQLYVNKMIRLGGPRPYGLCPVEAVNGAYEALRERTAVMQAADGMFDHDPALRAQLLQRTGLVESEHQP